MKTAALLLFVAAVAGCAQTSVQPLSRDTFKIATQAAPACGPQGARDVAFRTAAMEVIRQGGDRFIILSDQSGQTFGGATYNSYTGIQTFNLNNQDMVVKMLSTGDPQYRNGLSAREILGPDWQAQLAEGNPTTCT